MNWNLIVLGNQRQFPVVHRTPLNFLFFFFNTPGSLLFLCFQIVKKKDMLKFENISFLPSCIKKSHKYCSVLTYIYYVLHLLLILRNSAVSSDLTKMAYSLFYSHYDFKLFFFFLCSAGVNLSRIRVLSVLCFITWCTIITITVIFISSLKDDRVEYTKCPKRITEVLHPRQQDVLQQILSKLKTIYDLHFLEFILRPFKTLSHHGNSASSDTKLQLMTLPHRLQLERWESFCVLL